jgi:hypothetical protein
MSLLETIQSVNPDWTSLPSGPCYHSKSEKTTTLSSVDCVGKFVTLVLVS